MKNGRFNLLLFAFLFCGAAILSRLLFLQTKKHDFYEALAVGQQTTGELAQGQRGEIFFEDGSPLAGNKKGQYVFMSPREIKDKEETAQELSNILGVDFGDIDKIEIFPASSTKYRMKVPTKSGGDINEVFWYSEGNTNAYI